MNPAFKAQVETLNTLVTEFNLQNLTAEPWQLMNPLKAIIGVSLQVFTTYENEQTDIWKDDKKFKAYNNEWLENVKHNSDGKNYPKQLNEYAVAQGINKILYTVTLENGKVAIYDPERGYYQKDYKYAYKIIHVLQPTFNETKARNVLFLLSSMDRKFQYNGIHCDFEPEYRNNRVLSGIFR
jgi:hypothetical protein